MSHVPTVLKSDRSVFDKMLPVDDNNTGYSYVLHSVQNFIEMNLQAEWKRLNLDQLANKKPADFDMNSFKTRYIKFWHGIKG